MRITKVLTALALILACIFALVSCSDILHIHAFGEWETSREATCSMAGERIRKCECTYEEREDIPTIPHTIVVDGAIAPSCTESGLTEGTHCSVCLDVIVAQAEIGAKGHQWDGGRITKEPEVGAQGEKTFTCTVCGDTRIEPVDYVAPGGDTDEVTGESFKRIIESFLSVREGVMSAYFEKDGVKSFVTYRTNGENLHISRGIVGSNPNSNIYTTRVLGVDYRYDFVSGKWVLGQDVARQYRPYALSPFDAEDWGRIKDSFSLFTYIPEEGVYYTDLLSFEVSFEGVDYTVCEISLEIENGMLVGCNYTIDDGTSMLSLDTDFSGLGNTSVYLPWVHDTHNYTVFNEEHMVYRCAECIKLSYPNYSAEYVGGLYFVGDVVTKKDFKVVAHFDNGREFPVTDFVIKDGLLDYIENGISLYTKDDDYIAYVNVPAFNSDFLYTGVTDNGLIYLEEDGNLSIIGYIRSTKDVVIPEKIGEKSVVKIADDVFASSYSYIRSIKIPASVTEMSVSAIMSCYSLQSIDVDKENSVFCSIDGNLYSKDGTVLIKYAPSKSDESFAVPSGVEMIGDYAFEDCHNLSHLTLPDGLLYIGHQAFLSSYITEVNIPASVISIEPMSFDCCPKLKTITVDPLNDHYKDIDGNLYTKDGRSLIQYAIGKSATEFVVPDNVYYIEGSAFGYADNLVAVTISENVCYISTSAFRSPYFDATDASIKKVIFLDTEGWTAGGYSVSLTDPYDNAIYLLDDPFYPLTKEVDEPPFPDIGGDEEDDEDDPPIVEDEYVSYDEFRAEYYAKEFLQYDDSIAKDFYNSIVTDEKLVNSIIAWEAVHLSTDPSYQTGQMRRKDLYMLVIFDILTGNTQDFENPLESVYNEEEELMYEALGSIFGDKYVSTEDLMAFTPMQVADILRENRMFKYLDKVGFVWDLFENGLDAVNAVIRYKVISDMSLGYRNVLEEIYQNTLDEDLCEAAFECVQYFDQSFDAVLREIMYNEYVVESVKDTLFRVADDVWECLVTAVFPPVLIAGFAAKGTVVLCDSIFKLNEFNKAFYELHVAVMFEDAVRDVIKENRFDYSDPTEIEKYMCAVEIFQRSVLLGMQNSIALLEAKLQDPLVFPSDREQAEQTIERIYERKERQLSIYDSFEGNCYNFYYTYTEQKVGSLTPVETAMLYGISGIYYGEYSLGGERLDAMLLVIEREKLLGDYGYLSFIANYINGCSYDRDGQGIYTPDDIKNIVERQKGDYIAVFAAMLDYDNPSGSDSVYLMSATYLSESCFDFIAGECLWQGDRAATDFLKIFSRAGSLKGGVYIEKSKVGDIEVYL